MSIIARLIVTGTGTKKNRKLFDNFIAESKAERSTHTFVLLPGGFLTFNIKDSVDHISRIEPVR